MAVDIVLSFFATPGPTQAPADFVQPVDLFATPTRVAAAWPTGPGEHTKRFEPIGALRNPATKRLLPNLVALARRQLRLPQDETIGRVAAVGFSAGRWCLSELLRHPDDRASLDAVIDLDGMNLPRLANGQIDPGQGVTPQGFFSGSPGLGVWTEYGKLALDARHLLVNTHTDIAAPGSFAASTSAACAALYASLSQMVDAGAPAKTQPFDAAELYAGPPPPMVTTPAQAGDKRREWELMPPLGLESVGNCHKIHLEGNQAGFHIFSCYWLQAAVWRTFLVPRWNDPEKYECSSLSGPPFFDRVFRSGGPTRSAGLGAFGAAAGCAPKTTSIENWLVQDDTAADARWKTGEMDQIVEASSNPLSYDGFVETGTSVAQALVGAAIGFWCVSKILGP